MQRWSESYLSSRQDTDRLNMIGCYIQARMHAAANHCVKAEGSFKYMFYSSHIFIWISFYIIHPIDIIPISTYSENSRHGRWNFSRSKYSPFYTDYIFFTLKSPINSLWCWILLRWVFFVVIFQKLPLTKTYIIFTMTIPTKKFQFIPNDPFDNTDSTLFHLKFTMFSSLNLHATPTWYDPAQRSSL